MTKLRHLSIVQKAKSRVGLTQTEILERALESGQTPLEFLLEIMRDQRQDIGLRMEAAKYAAPFMHPKLAQIEHQANLKDTGPVLNLTLVSNGTEITPPPNQGLLIDGDGDPVRGSGGVGEEPLAASGGNYVLDEDSRSPDVSVPANVSGPDEEPHGGPI